MIVPTTKTAIDQIQARPDAASAIGVASRSSLNPAAGASADRPRRSSRQRSTCRERGSSAHFAASGSSTPPTARRQRAQRRLARRPCRTSTTSTMCSRQTARACDRSCLAPSRRGSGGTQSMSGGPEFDAATRAFEGGPFGAGGEKSLSAFVGFKYDVTDNMRSVHPGAVRRLRVELSITRTDCLTCRTSGRDDLLRQSLSASRAAAGDDGAERRCLQDAEARAAAGLQNWADDQMSTTRTRCSRGASVAKPISVKTGWCVNWQ